MAGRKRRKVLPLQGFLAHLAAAFVAVLCVAALGYGLWKFWPPLVRQWRVWTAGSVHARSDRREKASAGGDKVPAESVGYFKKENEALRESNRRLREQLQRTSETLARKTAETEELRLQKLILDRTRTAQP